MTQILLACANCGQTLAPDALACPNCGALVYRHRLEQLGASALELEASDPGAAMALWRECLDLLPMDSAQHRQIQDRVMLLGGAGANLPTDPNQPYTLNPAAIAYAPPQRPPDTLGTALFKTLGSMTVSMIVYVIMFGSIWLGVGFTLLILIHELGHVVAMRYYRLRAGPPIFIPFVGALINLRQQPPNAFVEAIVGIGGPLFGTLAALACYFGYLHFQHPALLIIAWFGFAMNLFNMLPVPPLDGGRVTAAVNPWVWMLGIIALAAWIINAYIRTGQVRFLAILILFYAWPRIRNTLRGRGMDTPYYQISRAASYGVGAGYVILGAILWTMYWLTSQQTHLSVF